MLKPMTIASKLEHRGRVVDLCTERVRFPNGREEDLDLIRHPGAAAVVAVDNANRVCLVRQYRHAVEDFLWEIPAGKLDAGEAPELCAIRELKEEAGVVAKRWTSLGIFFSAPGIFNEIIHLYLARDLEIGAPNPDVDEDLEHQWMPLQQAVDLVLRGDWNDGKTVVALLRARFELQL
ncbi:MAG TPA: NUDIX hydrolase [Steroidobacteraceae bacterium]|nr:NUDIX hydrolase [Steroidobacteraceae bacterium]